MDNLAHTLVGAALGRAGAGRELRAGGWVGAFAGNAPDWAELLLKPPSGAPRAGGEYLVYHRGITHSFVGAAVEIVALTGLVGLLMRLWARRAGPTPPPWRWVAACVTASVASHLYLDWQGSYGLRPFLPWSAQWYYADWIAIVDPFFWTGPLLALPLGGAHHRRASLPLGGPLRFGGQRRGRRVERRATARSSRGARSADDPPGSRDRAVRPVSRGGGRFERRRRGRIAVGCALPCAWVGSPRLGRGAGQAALTRLDWAAP